MNDDPESYFYYNFLKCIAISYIILFSLIKYYPEKKYISPYKEFITLQETYYSELIETEKFLYKPIISKSHIRLKKNLIINIKTIIIFLIIIFIKRDRKLIYYTFIKKFYLYKANAPPKN